MSKCKKSGVVPLERALSKLGLASRTRTREWILGGKLQVDGNTIHDPRYLVTPEKCKFTVEGKLLTPSLKTSVILLHKIRGVVTTCKDEKGRKTIYDLLPSHLHSFHPIGRLDMYTTGLLFLTNDTKLSSYLTDPKHAIDRVYCVSVRGEVSKKQAEQLEKGVQDGKDFLRAVRVVIRKASSKESHLIMTLTEGKNREIRRMCESLGREVTALKRVAFGSISLEDLPYGGWRELSEAEIKKLQGQKPLVASNREK